MNGPRRLLASSALLATLALPLGAEPLSSPQAVVLLIGDGLGISQLTLSRLVAVGEGGRLALESLPVTALVTTYSASNVVTDSGAAATAFASGQKTGNQYVGMDRSGQPVASLARQAQQRGWKVGLVTTTTITHATPAAFYAHVPDRYAGVAEIATQLLAETPDVALGGGLADFLPTADGGSRLDGRNLVHEAQAAGYTVLTRGMPLPAPAPPKILGLFAWSHLAYTLDDERYPAERRDPALADLTDLALASLEQAGKPFFLMIEGGRIDHAAHSFDAAGTVAETVSFDHAVARVLDYQRRHPDTLVVLTADHATGGLAINDYADLAELKAQKASVEWMANQIRNSDAGPTELASWTGYEDFTAAELATVRDEPDSYEAARNLGRLLADRDGITWIPRVNSLDTKGHTGEDVALFAGGPGAERFQGVLDNADIPRRLAALMGWELGATP